MYIVHLLAPIKQLCILWIVPRFFISSQGIHQQYQYIWESEDSGYSNKHVPPHWAIPSYQLEHG